MECRPQNPEFRINPENFHLCIRLLSYNLKARVYSTYLGEHHYHKGTAPSLEFCMCSCQQLVAPCIADPMT